MVFVCVCVNFGRNTAFPTCMFYSICLKSVFYDFHQSKLMFISKYDFHSDHTAKKTVLFFYKQGSMKAAFLKKEEETVLLHVELP